MDYAYLAAGPAGKGFFLPGLIEADEFVLCLLADFSLIYKKTTSMEQPDNMFDLQIDQQSLNYLNESARWGKFLSILGFISIGFMIIFGIFFGAAMTRMMSEMNSEAMAFGKSGLGFIYILCGLILFFPTLYLYNFSSKMRRAIRDKDQQVLAESLKNLKSLFKFYGVFTIILLSFYTLVIFAALIGMMVGSRH
jgi:hypothetical protein